jgi:hypothetical protein
MIEGQLLRVHVTALAAISTWTWSSGSKVFESCNDRQAAAERYICESDRHNIIERIGRYLLLPLREDIVLAHKIV